MSGFTNCNANIPHPTITTLNVNGLSAHSVERSSKTARRHRNIIGIITTLLQTSDILCLQETKLGANDSNALKLYFPHHTIHYNNDRINHAGTIIITSPSITNRYHLRPIILPATAKGRVQALAYLPKPQHQTTSLPFQVINVYLQSGNLPAERARQLDTLLSLTPSRYLFLTGDFNFIESPSDSSGDSASLIGGAHLDQWTNLQDHLQVSEIHQSTHTYYRHSENLTSSHTSRLDRVYASYDTDDLEVLTPTTYIPHTTINALQRASNHSPAPDHLPVTFRAYPNEPPRSSKRASRIPAALAADPIIRQRIESRWAGSSHHENQYVALDRWKSIVREVVDKHYSDRHQLAKLLHADANELTTLLRILRHCSRPNPDLPRIRALLSPLDHPALLVDTTALPIDTSKLRARLRELRASSPVDADDDVDDETTEQAWIPPPSSAPISTTRHANHLKELASALPSTRKPLRALRRTAREEPTSDPEEMGNLLTGFWSKIWSKRSKAPTAQQLSSYLANYHTRIPPHLQPALPTLDECVDGINGSGNSSAGPDGIPFAFYRAFSLSLGPLIHRITHSLASGELPPPGYNHALLYLLPKNDSLLPSATRPISVTNCDNRIIAKLITIAITPALQHALLPAQKGFVPGRVGTQHVLDITQSYYSALNAQQQHYILFLDTAKAFDSLDHAFILAVLAQIGLPPWLTYLVEGLLNDVIVFLVLSQPTNHSITIERGVKQGCPLSPLLFVLCYDVLLSYLLQHRDHEDFGYADDLAIASTSISTIAHCLHTINTFARFSGLGLNLSKTTILTALPPTRTATALLALAGFHNIKFVDSATYLGVLMGQRTTTLDVFASASDKFYSRSRRYHTFIRNSTLHNRIIIFNIFLIPLLLYLAQFYIIPYTEIVVRIKEHTRRAIIPYNGGGFGYAQLITPRDRFGPHTPLRDLWATNITLLAQTYPLSHSHGHLLPQLPDHPHVTSPDWGSMLIAEHRAWAAFAYLECYNPRDALLRIDVARLNGKKGAKVRRLLYRDCVLQGYWQERDSAAASYPTSLPNKINRFSAFLSITTTTAAASHLRAHAKLVGRRLRPNRWNLQLRLTYNALPTDHRRSRAMAVPQRPSSLTRSPFPCYLCGKGVDSIVHLYGGDCEVVGIALRRFSLATGHNFHHNLTTALLLFPPTTTIDVTLLLISFNWAVWYQRTSYFASLAHPPPLLTAAHRLAAFALDRKIITAPKSISTTSAIAQLVTDPPADALVTYTDGSAIPNPGPAAAGLWLSIPSSSSSPAFHLELVMPLGHANNNSGEIHALDVGFTIGRWSHAHLHFDSPPPLLFISDSFACIGYILHGWSFKDDVPTARRARSTFHALTSSAQARLYWVRGHAQVDGNERADKLAKLGAKGQRSPPHPTTTTTSHQLYYRFTTTTGITLSPLTTSNPNMRLLHHHLLAIGALALDLLPTP